MDLYYGADEEEIPTIDASMTHWNVDFERGMPVAPTVALVLIALCAIVFGVEIGYGLIWQPAVVLEMGALDHASVARGEIWRMVSATVLHANIEHLLGNLVMLYVLGLACEHGYGRSQFIVLYVLAALGGSFCSLLDNQPSVGASGAIFGLGGAVVALFRRHRDKLHLRDKRIGFVIAFWAGYTILLGFVNPNVDNLAHLGGLLTGFCLGWVLPPAVLYGRDHVGAQLWVRWSMSCALLIYGTGLIAFSLHLLK